jgi:hypothetical protein
LFRLKPYSFVALVPFALACCIRPDRRRSIPLVAASMTTFVIVRNVKWVGPGIVLHYYQLIGLVVMIAAVLLTLAIENWRRKQHKTAKAQLWIDHDKAQSGAEKKSPGYYD